MHAADKHTARGIDPLNLNHFSALPQPLEVRSYAANKLMRSPRNGMRLFHVNRTSTLMRSAAPFDTCVC